MNHSAIKNVFLLSKKLMKIRNFFPKNALKLLSCVVPYGMWPVEQECFNPGKNIDLSLMELVMESAVIYYIDIHHET